PTRVPGLRISSSLNDPATTALYTLSLHDALPISPCAADRTELELACGKRHLRGILWSVAGAQRKVTPPRARMPAGTTGGARASRSEERRVGKGRRRAWEMDRLSANA